MPQTSGASVENNFTKGLVTDLTGLNFPENSATDTDNCTYSLVGDVTRRLGFDLEEFHGTKTVVNANLAKNSYIWKNAGGDGDTQIYVAQIGGTLHFWNITASTESSPVSNQIIASTVVLSSYLAAGASFDSTLETEFAAGNGYLFVWHPNCEPIYCTFAAGVISANSITIYVRDIAGLLETNIPDSLRPATLTDIHKYNLINQGWSSGNPWSATSSTNVVVNVGAKTFIIQTGLTITAGQPVNVSFTSGGPVPMMFGTVTSYNSGTGSLVLAISTVASGYAGTNGSSWNVIPLATGFIDTWHTQIGNYPSNVDVWWNFKDSTDAFNPTTTLANTSIGGPAPKGSVIFPAFNQQRGAISGVSNIPDVTTTVRPRTGTWFQGRVWYTGVDASSPASGIAPYTTWTENIYFSQIVQSTADFGKCYQLNDLTSETLFDLLPTDGGVIQIQGIGSIYKLFPIQNGLLVFGATGIKFITGSQGIGFSATDYTVNDVADIQSISGTSFVNVNGYPYFWNEDGIYTVQPKQGGGLSVDSVSVGVIGSLYADIPTTSRVYARGTYNPIEFVIQWAYRNEQETDVTSRYSFDRILNYNTYSKAFYPYSVDDTNVKISGINYINTPGLSNAIEPGISYLTTFGTSVTLSDEHDDTYVDWASATPASFESYLITGYKLHGQGQRRFQLGYLYTYSRNDVSSSYKIQGLWDYAVSGDSGRWSTAQIINNSSPNFGMIVRRHKIRGQGLVLQLKIKSAEGMPFDIMGWSAQENVNTGQ